MSQSVLGTMIVLSGRVDNQFGKIGDALTVLGSQVNEVSQDLMNLGKESVETYRNYQDNMLAAEVALATQYGRNSTELQAVMKGLDEAAQQWAASTIFHTDDVSLAISNAAHAGWDYEEILLGIPAAMNIAQAGQMDLSTGLEMMIRILNSSGTAFEDAGKLVDAWAFSANASSTNIDAMGEALVRLGATSQFAESTDEVMAMLGALGNMGVTGSEAGTMLRNMMIRLIAPTDKASVALQKLEVSEEELEEALSGGNAAEAMEKLAEVGFSVYDDGKLRSMTDIFTGLREAVMLIGGDDWKHNQSVMDIVSAIFPTRVVTGAMDMIEQFGGEYQELLTGIEGSAGYGSYGTKIMIKGLTGDIETLDSKVEALRLKLGAVMEGDVSEGAGLLGGFIDAVNGMDEGLMSALVGGLEVIAGVGPTLLIAGTAVKLIGTVISGGWAGAAMLAGVGALALANGMKKLGEVEFKRNFGDMALDVQTLKDNLSTTSTLFSERYEELTQFDVQLNETETKYQELGKKLASRITTAAITGEDIGDGSELIELGVQIQGYVMQGIEQAQASDYSFLNMLFESGSIDAETYGAVVEGLDEGYTRLELEARQIGEDLRNMITEALQDETLSPEEEKAIEATIARNDEIMAKIQEGTQKEAYYAMLRKGQNVSYDSYDEYMQLVAEGQAQALGLIDEQYYAKYGRMKRIALEGVDQSVIDAAGGEDAYLAQQAEWVALEAGWQQSYDAARANETAKYGTAATNATKALMTDEQWQMYMAAQEILALNGGNGIDSGAAIEWALAGGNWQQFVGKTGLFGSLAKRLDGYTDFAGAAELQSVFSAMDMLTSVFGEYQNWSKTGAEKAWEPVQTPVETNGAEAGAEAKEEAEEYLGSHPIETTVVVNGVEFRGNPFDLVGLGLPMDAEGGRETSPAIFGEAGPEWAIPEKHTERTAELLNAARAASGFTWGELIARNGGLNAGGNGSVIYSPNITVNGGDASGLDAILQRDKERLFRWFAERERQNALTAYV